VVGGDIHWAQAATLYDVNTKIELLQYYTSSAITSEPVQGKVALLARVGYKMGPLAILEHMCSSLKLDLHTQVFGQNNYLVIHKDLHPHTSIMKRRTSSIATDVPLLELGKLSKMTAEIVLIKV